MSATTLDTGGIVYEKINLGGQDYYQEKEPLGKGTFSEVYTVYPCQEDDSIDLDNPYALKVYKKVRGKPWEKTAKEALQEAKVLNTQFKTQVYSLAATADQTGVYTLLTEQATFTPASVAILMPKFPGQPILSPTGELHPGLAKLTALQRLQLAALVVKTLMELSVDFTDLKPENILIDIQIDEDGNASFGCYPIDFAGYGRTVMTAAPEWNGFDIQCDFFLVPELNPATLEKLSITENAIILTNDNRIHFVIAGNPDEKNILENIDRQGLEFCGTVIQVQNPQTSRIIAEAAKESHYLLGNHDKTMEVYSALSILAPILGETDVYSNKKAFSRHKTKETRQAPFCLENMTTFLLAIIAKKADPLLTHAINQVIRSLEAMQNLESEQRPGYKKIDAVLCCAASLLQQNLEAKPSIFENEALSEKEETQSFDHDDSASSSGSDNSDSEKIVPDRLSLPSEERSFVDSSSTFSPFTFFHKSCSELSRFSVSELSRFVSGK